MYHSIKVTGSFCSSLHWRNFIDEKLQEGNDREVGLWSNDSYFIYYSLHVHFFGLAHAQHCKTNSLTKGIARKGTKVVSKLMNLI